MRLQGVRVGMCVDVRAGMGAEIVRGRGRVRRHTRRRGHFGHALSASMRWLFFSGGVGTAMADRDGGG